MTAVRESTSLYLNTESHRQTDIGWLPVDWDVMPFESIAKIERGKFTARPRNDPRLYGGEFPFIQTGDVANSNGFVRTFSQTLNSEGLKVSKWFPEGTLFFTIAANIGDVALSTFGTAAPDSLVAITPHQGICKNWLIQELRAKKSLFEGLASHNAQANINLEKLNPVLLPVPPLAEQEAIASALGDADALIESLEQLLAKKRLIKHGAMQELLTGKRRLPGFEGDWKSVQLTNVAKLESGHTPSRNRPEYWNGDVPWVSLHDSKLLDVDEVTKTSLAITELGLLNSSARLLPQGTVIFSRTATIGKSSVLGCPMATSQDFANYVCGPEVYNHFLVRLFRFMEKDWKRLMAGSTHNTIYMPVFKKLRVTIPKFEEQVAIVDHLRSLETETRLLEDKIAKARFLKQAMMQQLLTGRIRLV